MMKLTVDWAGEGMPELGLMDGDEVQGMVEFDATPGPSGHPTVTVVVMAKPGVPAHREAMELDAWLQDAYGEQDEDMRQELLDTAS